MSIKELQEKFYNLLKDYLRDEKIKNHPLLLATPDDLITNIKNFITTEENKITQSFAISEDNYLERAAKLANGYNITREKNKDEAIKLFNQSESDKQVIINNYEQLKLDTKILNETNNNINIDHKSIIQRDYIEKLKKLTEEKNQIEEAYNIKITSYEDNKLNKENELANELGESLDKYQALKTEANSGYQLELNKLIPNKENYYNNLTNEKNILERTIKEQYGATNKYINDISIELDVFFKNQEFSFKEKYSQVFQEKKTDLEKIINLTDLNQEIKSLLTDKVLLLNQQKEAISKNNLDELTAFFREYKHYKMLVPLAKRELFQKTNIFHNKNLELADDAFNKTEKLQTELIDITHKIKLNNLEKQINLKKTSRQYESYLNNARYQQDTQIEQSNYRYALKKNELEEDIARLKYIIERKKLDFTLTQKKDSSKFQITKVEFANQIENDTLDLKRELSLHLLKRKNLIALYNQKNGETKSYFDSRQSIMEGLNKIITNIKLDSTKLIEEAIKNIIYAINYTTPLSSVLPYMSERLIDYLDIVNEYINYQVNDIAIILNQYNIFAVEYFTENMKKILDRDLKYMQEIISSQVDYINAHISKNIEGLKREQAENKTEINRLTIVVENMERQVGKYLKQLKKLSLINLDKTKDTEETYKSNYQKLDLELRINKIRLNNLIQKDSYYQSFLPKNIAINTKQEILMTNFRVEIERLAQDFKLSLIRIIESINTEQLNHKELLEQITIKAKSYIQQIGNSQNNIDQLNKKIAQFVKLLKLPFNTINAYINTKSINLNSTLNYYYKIFSTIKNNTDNIIAKIRAAQMALSFSRENSYNSEIKLMLKLNKDYMSQLQINRNLSVANKEAINTKEKNELITQIKKLNAQINELISNKNSEQKIIKQNIEAMKTSYLTNFNQKSSALNKEYNQIEKDLFQELELTKKRLQQIENSLEKQFINTYEKFLFDKDYIQAKLQKDIESSENNLNTMIFLLNDKNEQVKNSINKELSVINHNLKKLGYVDKEKL